MSRQSGRAPQRAQCVAVVAVVGASLCSAGELWAQALDAGRVYDSVQPQRPSLPKPAAASVKQNKGATATPGAAVDARVRLQVNEWRITGATAIPAEQLQPLLLPWMGKALGVAELQEAAGAVTQAYRDAGFIYTRATVLPQTIKDGVVTLTVQEDRLARLGLDESGALALPRFVRDGVARSQPLGEPVNVPSLERTLLRINRLPGAGKASAELTLADAGDASALDVRYQPAERLSGLVRVDNHGNRYTGRARLLGVLNLNNPFGRADRLSATMLSAGAPMAYGSLAYAVPLSLFSRLDIATSALRYELCCQAPGRRAEGRVQAHSAALSHDAVVQRDRHLAWLLAMEWRELDSDLDSAAETRRNVRALRLGAQGYWLGASVNYWAAGLHAGRADLSGHAPDLLADAPARQVDGAFQKLVLSYARAPDPGSGWGWSVDLNSQYNLGRNLESSERFALGGADAVRAYAAGEATGDSGWVTQLALHYRWGSVPGLAVSGFVDTGRVRQYSKNTEALATGSPNNYSLTGLGVGLSLARPGYELALTVAEPVGHNRGLDAQGLDAEGHLGDKTRGWVSVDLAF